MLYIFKAFGIAGLILISAGIILKKRVSQDILYIVGGVFLTVYSIFIGDILFISLQIIFVFAAVYNLFKLKFKF
ncbi:MAG: hypothetical protein WC459_02945 [Patescibacteria group bacterium]